MQSFFPVRAKHSGRWVIGFFPERKGEAFGPISYRFYAKIFCPECFAPTGKLNIFPFKAIAYIFDICRGEAFGQKNSGKKPLTFDPNASPWPWNLSGLTINFLPKCDRLSAPNAIAFSGQGEAFGPISYRFYAKIFCPECFAPTGKFVIFGNSA